MPHSSFAQIARVRRTPLAIIVGAFLGCMASTAIAENIVQNCYDSGAGSLRQSVMDAPDGGVVNAYALTTASPGCSASTITLHTGAIAASQTNLTIVGPNVLGFRISGKYTHESDRIIKHTGSGVLKISNFSVYEGILYSATGNAYGGCIYSAGSVYFTNASASFCTARTKSGVASGGALFARHQLHLQDADITESTANTTGSGTSRGGGIAVNTGLHYQQSLVSVVASTISNNSASSTSGQGYGGGIYSNASITTIDDSEISANTASVDGGGVQVISGVSSYGALYLSESTVSGNSAGAATGGVYAKSPYVTINNSTIVLNYSKNSTLSHAPGLAVIDTNTSGNPAAFQLISTLIDANTYGTSAKENDFSVKNGTTSGSNNLIRTTSADVPADTIIGHCAMISPLMLNGGRTRTHALRSGSPAIDRGYAAAAQGLDQRGFARSSGPPGRTAVPDIGAYEVNQSDIVFNADFDPCL
jgi:hypothetical protein